MAQITLNSTGVASNGTLALQSNGTTTAVTVDASQNVGVGRSPNYQLDVYRSGTTNTTVASANDNVVNILQVSGNTAGVIGTITSHPLVFTAGNTERMRIDSSGNVGIGTSSPQRTLHVENSSGNLVRLNNSSSANGSYSSIELTSTGGNNCQIRGVQDSSTAGHLEFYTLSASAVTERMRIDSSGNLLVGTASATGKITVQTSGNTYGVFSENTNTITTLNYYFWGYGSGSSRFIAYGNGGIANYSANNVNLSDRREKTNFAPAGGYLTKICAIPVQTFNYIDQNLEEDGGLTLGIVAQDVQAVAPELITESNWGTEEEPKMRLSIYQTDLQYALMKSIQELKALVDTQASTITQLQADVAALKGTA